MPGTDYSTQFNDSCLIIASDGNAYHPVATNHFTVTIRLPETLINYADPRKRTFAEIMSTDDLQLTLKVANDSIQEPTLNQQSLVYSKGNLSIEFPGRIDAFSGTANFHVFVTKSAYDILYSWKMAAGNHLTGEVGDPDEYWGEVQIDVTTGNKGTLVASWLWHNVWCNQLQGVTFSAAQNETKAVQIGMKYFRPEYIGGQYLEG